MIQSEVGCKSIDLQINIKHKDIFFFFYKDDVWFSLGHFVTL